MPWIDESHVREATFPVADVARAIRKLALG